MNDHKWRESDYTHFPTASISNCTVIPHGSTTTNPFVVSFISCCFLLIFLSLHLTLLYTVVQSYTPLAQLHVLVGVDCFTPFHVFAPI